MTEEDRKEILAMIEKGKEQTLLLLPEIIGKMMVERITMTNMVRDFYKENPDFQKHTDVVQAVLEDLEAQHPGKQYQEIIKLAQPEIKRRIATIGTLDMATAQKPIMPQYSGSIGEI